MDPYSAHRHADQPEQTWAAGASNTSLPLSTDEIKKAHLSAQWTQWTPPPVPPIPNADEELAMWHRRSLKRDSYTSRSLRTPSTLSIAVLPTADRNDLRPESAPRPHSAYRSNRRSALRLRAPAATDWDPHWEVDSANPRNWSLLSKCFHTLGPGECFPITDLSPSPP